MSTIEQMAKEQAIREAFNEGIEKAISMLRTFEQRGGWIKERSEVIVRIIRECKRN